MLIPPLNWCLVERGLSRSGVPSRINLEFLARQKLKTIVVLAHPDQEDDEDPTANMEQQVSDTHTHTHIGRRRTDEEPH